MAAIAGVGASVLEASTAFTNASKWMLNIKGATKDVTPFGASGNWTINIATLKSWSGTISAFLDTADTAQTNLFALIGSTLASTFNVGVSSHGFTGNIILTEIDPTADVQNAETVDFKFVGTGPCTYS